MKKALITGVTGQDGAYLSKFLLGKGYKVYGGIRRSSNPRLDRLEYLGIANEIEYIQFDLLDVGSVIRGINCAKPDEIYNLAAQSFVQASFDQPVATCEFTALGALRVLEAINLTDNGIKFYQASSSEMFGKAEAVPQNEKTQFHPRSPYGVAKVFGHHMTVNYREAYDMFACSGILFNHESPLRGIEFVTRKITYSVAEIAAGLQEKLYLGNLDAKRDWGYAAEYVEAMWLMLQQDKPDDYVIATGETHSVKEFVEIAFKSCGLNWEDHVEIDPKHYRPAEVELLVGDSSKAKQKFNWEPKTSFEQLVKIMVDADVKRVKEKLI